MLLLLDLRTMVYVHVETELFKLDQKVPQTDDLLFLEFNMLIAFHVIICEEVQTRKVITNFHVYLYSVDW